MQADLSDRQAVKHWLHAWPPAVGIIGSRAFAVSGLVFIAGEE